MVRRPATVGDLRDEIRILDGPESLFIEYEERYFFGLLKRTVPLVLKGIYSTAGGRGAAMVFVKEER